MADEATGGTSGDVDAGKETTFTQADLEKAVAAAKEAAAKEARAEEYRKSQSLIDKERAKTGKLSKQLQEINKQRIANLPEEERTKAMIEDLYSRLSDPKATDEDDDEGDKKGEKPSTSAAETAQEAQKRMRDIAKNQGLDPEKLDFSSEEGFIKSIISQRKAEAAKEETDPNGGPVDTGNHSGGGGKQDYSKLKPEELISRSRKNWKPIRGLVKQG